MSIQLLGYQELKQKFADLKDKDITAAIGKGTRAAAKVVADAFKEAIPSVSGLTRQSIKVRALKRSRVRIGHRVEVKALDPQGRPYPSFVELGSKRISARHYEKDAADEAASQALELAAEETAQELEKRAAKVSGA